MNYHLSDGNVCTHPLALLPYKDYKRLQHNIIVLHHLVVTCGNTLHRKIHYDIQSIGKNLVFEVQNGIRKIKLNETKMKYMMIVLHKEEVGDIKSASPFAHQPKRKDNKKSEGYGSKYLILMQSGIFPKSDDDISNGITESDIINYTRAVPNQIRSKEKHFKSMGEVYSIGYSAKYKVENGLSFEHFVTSKCLINCIKLNLMYIYINIYIYLFHQ